MAADIVYEVLPPEKWKDAVSLVEDEFVCNEPVHTHWGLTPEIFDEMMPGGMQGTIQNNVAIIARNGAAGEIVGIKLFHILKRGETQKGWADVSKTVHEKAAKILHFVSILEKDCDVFVLYPSASKAYVHVALAVRKAFRGMGIATTLVRKSDEYATNRECDVSKVLVTSIGSFVIFRKVGYEIVRELGYETFEKDGRKMFDVAKMGDSKVACVMTKKLR